LNAEGIRGYNNIFKNLNALRSDAPAWGNKVPENLSVGKVGALTILPRESSSSHPISPTIKEEH
jgi:hypothetical protein